MRRSFLIFIFFVAFIAICTSIITTKTLVGYMNIPYWLKTLVLFVIFGCWIAPIISMWLKRVYSNVPFVIYTSDVLHFVFGFAFLLFVILLSRDIFWYIGYYFKKLPDPKDLYWLNRANILALSISLLISFYALYEGTKEPSIKEVDIYSDKVSSDFSIILITDWHINQGTTKKDIQKIVDRVNVLSPDVVLLVGDIIDDKSHIIGDKIDLIDGFVSKYGNYISFGNHEFYNGLESWRARFNSIENIKLLDNSNIELSDINISITGIPDTRIFNNYPQHKPDFDVLMKDVQSSRYKIILSHAPDFAKQLPEGVFDLQVSGHTHGGQIFPFHILAKLENKFLAGLYDERGTNVYVSRGAGYWGPPIRLFAPSEITLIRIKPNEKK